MRINEFFNTDFKEFSSLDNVRSIPSLIDGLKDSQRKAVYAMMQHGNSEIKVAQFAGKAALITKYAHGETSMADTIVGLAQKFTGSNNVNLFDPIGQFGSILSSESSSHRYIFTKPSKHLYEYFKVDDECILDYKTEDDDQVEPVHFLPIVPMWIVNGTVGIGTGHSVKIFSRDPVKVKKAIEKIIKNGELTEKEITTLLQPYFNNWKGQVIDLGSGKFELHGCIEVINKNTLHVSELPINYGIDKFKSILVNLIEGGIVKDYDNNSTEKGFDITIKLTKSDITKKPVEEIKQIFKLISRQSENITLWDENKELKKYDDIYQPLHEFVRSRLKAYGKRKIKQYSIYEGEMDFLKQKKLFIQTWNTIDNPGKKKIDVLNRIMLDVGVQKENLERLFSLRISSLSFDQISKLENEIKIKKEMMKELKSKAIEEMYLSEIF